MDINRSIERSNRTNRSDTISSTGPVPVSVGNPTNMNGPAVHMERRSTIDSIMNNPVRQQYNTNTGDRNDSQQQQYMEPSGQDDDRVSYLQSGRQSMYYDDVSSSRDHRKSRIGGMFKKMFKKDEQQH